MGINLLNKLVTQRALRAAQESSDASSSAFERLSSGLRINRSSDDAAGLALAMTLRTDSVVFGQAARNVNDGISVLSIAEAALNELGTITSRIKELATQAANGSFTSTQRFALDAEAQALAAEYSRIVHSTTYNGRKLLDGSYSNVAVQAGGSAADIINLSIGAVETNSTTTYAGTGTFASQVTIAAGTQYYDVLVADFNGDGINDLLTSAGGSTGVRLLYGNGNGTFKASVNPTTAAGTVFYVATGDFNGDGIPDIASSINTGSVAITLGNGNGTFKASQTYAAGGTLVQTVATDITGDGISDIIVSNYSAGSFTVLVGNGNGTFQVGTSFATGGVTDGISYGDLNGDGKIDLVVSDVTLGVYFGNGNGTFNAKQTLAAGGYNTIGPTVADLNGDGYLDIADVGTATGQVNIRLGNGNGTFKALTTFTHSASTMYEVLARDVNGDSKLDLLVAGNNFALVMLGNGNGTFSIGTSYAAGVSARGIAAGDLNGDGVADMVSAASTSQDLRLFFANTTSTTVSGLSGISLATQASALSAITTADSVLTTLSSVMGTVGAQLSRLDVAARSLATRREIFEGAYRRIMDVDVAEELSKAIRNQVLYQAALAVLAQANQSQSVVLQLLK